MKLVASAVAAAAIFVAPTAASAGNGYGAAIQDCLGASYGQAKNAAWDAGHASKPALGAKDTALAHGCVTP